jgi:molybdopterin converting factor small subunit
MQKAINLQLFANLDEVITANEKAFEGSNVKEQFSSIASKLSELGYDVLLNNKKQAEFVPSSRLSEVVGQRDQFKGKVEDLNATLLKMQKDAGDNQGLKDQLQGLMDQNNSLLKEIEQTKINAEIMLGAKDAINAKDVLAFIDMNNVKVNAKGEVLGVDGEIARIKQEKPYLFATEPDDKKRKGGMDNSGGREESRVGGMNSMIRRAAGKTF